MADAFWPADRYQPDRNPPLFDKQFVCDGLETTGWDKQSPLPADITAKTRAKSLDAYARLTGSPLP
jgi:phosphoribosylaminoimidazole-succinocarboxamide synthase